MLIKQQTVTPIMAKEYLERNAKNRPVSLRKVEQYTRDMREGKWKQSGDPIRFAINGDLLDGQHRLMAIIKAKTAIPCVCIFDLDESVFEVIDTGKVRSAADLLGIQGIKNRVAIAASARHQYLYINGVFDGHDTPQLFVRPTNQDIMTIVKTYPALIESAHKMAGYDVLRGLLPPSLIGFFHMNFCRIDQEKGEEFFLILDGRVTADVRSPVMLLRQRLIENKIAKQKMKQTEKAAITIKAWNSFYANKPMGKLAYKVNETFPVFE